MTDPPPPPPGPYGPPPPPPPPATPWSGPPPTQLAPTAATGSAGLRTATIILLWCTAAATVFILGAVANRRSVWGDFVDGDFGFGDVDRIDDADAFVEGAFGVTFLLALATVIVLSIWSLRVGRRARQTGATDVSSGLFCGSWYIPYAAAIVPFIQLRRVARHRQRSTTSANLWQGFLIALWVTASALLGLEPDEDDEFADVSDVTDRLDAQVGVSVVTMIVALVAAFFAMQALRTIDDERPAAPR